MQSRILLASAFVIAFAMPAMAEIDPKATQIAQSVARQTIRLQDRDGDGHISLKESAGATVILFQSIDMDGSGLISVAEMTDAAKTDAEALRISNGSDESVAIVQTKFQMMDIDGDASISLPEMLAVTEAVFNAADINSDGRVSEDELLSLAIQHLRSEDSR